MNTRIDKIKTYSFSPISNIHQSIHSISIRNRINKGKQSVLKPHRTNFYVIILFTHGNAKHMIDNNIYHVKRGNLIVIYPGQIHCFYDIDNVDGAILAFTENFILNSNSTNESSLMFKLLLELENANKYSFEKSNLHNIESIINRINIELTKSYDELQKSFLQNYLCALLLNLTREKMESLKLQDRNQTEVFYGNKFKRLVQENHKKTIMVTNYAKMLGISVRFLQNTTKSLYGKSPKAFIHEYVLLESKKLLMDSNLQVKEISYMMGFDEPTNFTKFFKKYCKVSPNEFRKTIIYH